MCFTYLTRSLPAIAVGLAGCVGGAGVRQHDAELMRARLFPDQRVHGMLAGKVDQKLLGSERMQPALEQPGRVRIGGRFEYGARAGDERGALGGIDRFEPCSEQMRNVQVFADRARDSEDSADRGQSGQHDQRNRHRRRRLMDVMFLLVRSSEDRGYYRVPPGRYGVGGGELLLVECGTGRVMGIVKR